MSPAKIELQEIERTNQYVFHGSGSEIEEFEPRQAFNYINGEQIPDGEPAIFASSVIDYAILMAIINKRNCPNGFRSSAGTTSGDGVNYITRYRATKDTIDQLNNESCGWVYVFDKNLFKQRDKGGVEYISTTKVQPSRKIKVKKEDLPDNLEIN